MGLKKHLVKVVFLNVLLLFFAGASFAATTYDWRGTVNTSWTTPGNWYVGGFQQIFNYPGSGSSTDIVQIGVTYALTRQPILSTALANPIASLTFGDGKINGAAGSTAAMTLTVNGTLTVSGAITQKNTTTGNNGIGNASPFYRHAVTTYITGSGTINCASFAIGDASTPVNSNVINVMLVKIGSSIGGGGNLAFNVTGNVTIASSHKITGGVIVSSNDDELSLAQGNLTIGGQLQLANTGVYTSYQSADYQPLTFFTIDLFNNSDNAVLTLKGATPLSIQIGDSFNLADFYHVNAVGGTGTATVNYAGTNQEVYTYSSTGMNSQIENGAVSDGDGLGVYQYLTFSGSGTKTVDAGDLTVYKDMTLSGTATVNMTTNTPNVSVGGNYSAVNGTTLNYGSSTAFPIAGTTTNAGTFTQTGTGNVIMTGSVTNSGTITQGGGPFDIAGAMINSGNLNLGSANFSMAGDYTNSGNFTAGSGTAVFNGAGTQNLAGGAGTGTAFNNVNFTGGSNKQMLSGNFSVSSISVMTLSGTNTKVTTGSGNLKLISDATGSATIAALTNGCQVNGNNVTVQRYLSANRGYRLIASPVNSVAGVADAKGNYTYSLNYVQNTAYITGTSATGGFDKVGNPTLYLYREDVPVSNITFISGNFRGINNITVSAPPYSLDNEASTYTIPVSNGFLFFYRGDRTKASVNTETSTTYIATAATLGTTGTVNQGQIVFRDWYTPASQLLGYSNPNIAALGFNLAGNPYPSTIDWETYTNTNNGTGIFAANLSDFVYELNPLTKNYDEYEAGKGGTVFTNNGSRYIASGQGFFVLATTTGGQLIFNESAKTTTPIPSGNLLMGKPIATNITKSMRLELAKDTINKDNILLLFDDNAKPGFVFNEDAPYRQGLGAVSLSSVSGDNMPLAINRLPLSRNTVIPLNVNVDADGVYTLNTKEIKAVPQLYDIWLKDALKKDSVNMRSTVNYSFSIIKNDSATFGSKRFSIVIHENPALAYKLIAFDANKVDKKTEVQLIWKTLNEQNYTHFTIERSNDNGKTFEVVGSAASAAEGTYSLLDKKPLNGVNLYRLKQEDYFNTISYSDLVEVIYSDKNSLTAHLSIYPNPAANNISLTIIPKLSGNTTYNIRVTNSTGLVVKTAVVTQPYWQDNVSRLLTGTYLIQVTDKRDNSIVGQTKFVKL